MQRSPKKLVVTNLASQTFGREYVQRSSSLLRGYSGSLLCGKYCWLHASYFLCFLFYFFFLVTGGWRQLYHETMLQFASFVASYHYSTSLSSADDHTAGYSTVSCNRSVLYIYVLSNVRQSNVRQSNDAKESVTSSCYFCYHICSNILSYVNLTWESIIDYS